jgi:DNA-binding transcriptional regulator GbsR (MarR family)
MNSSDPLEQAREAFINQWGAMGSSWGISRTMALIHALLLASNDPLSTDDVMDQLEISRGNAHMNLKDLVAWGLVHSVVRKGERKEYFEAEKDGWTIFQIISRERARREIEPAIRTLQDCADMTSKIKSPEAKSFHALIKDLADLVGTASALVSRVAKTDRNAVVNLAVKHLKPKG